MLIDVHTYVGHWPFRRLPDNDVAGLLRNMDRCDIDLAVVASIHGVFYKNVHEANLELAETVADWPDRLIPFATLNPLYAAWERDLRTCVDMGFKGLRLYPQYHGYQLADRQALELVDAATALGWPIQVPQRLVDRRGSHRWDLAEDLTLVEWNAALAVRPQAKWMLLTGIGIERAACPTVGPWLADMGRMDVVLRRTVQHALDAYGVAHLAWGSGLPFSMPEPALLKLRLLDVSSDIKERITWRNAAAMLGLDLD